MGDRKDGVSMCRIEGCQNPRICEATIIHDCQWHPGIENVVVATKGLLDAIQQEIEGRGWSMKVCQEYGGQCICGVHKSVAAAEKALMLSGL